METEIWKEIKGYEGMFAVSNLGRVKSLARRVSNHTGFINKPERILKPIKDIKGYLRVYLSKNNKNKFTPIHRLVSFAFIPNPENKPQVNHIDGNKQNNHVENLEWCTNRENSIHAIRMGLNDHSKYESGRPKRKVNQIDISTGKIIKTFNSIADASREFKTSNIGECCRGKYGRKTVCGYKWEFAK